MPYDDWDDQFRGFFDDIPGADYLSSEEANYAEALFEAGFTHHSAELEALGLSMDDVEAIRAEFFEFMGIDSADFDWEGWREAMGYD